MAPPSRQGSVLRLNTYAVIDGTPDSLLAAEIALGRLNRNVTQQKLDLLQFPSSHVTEPGTGSPEVVR